MRSTEPKESRKHLSEAAQILGEDVCVFVNGKPSDVYAHTFAWLETQPERVDEFWVPAEAIPKLRRRYLALPNVAQMGRTRSDRLERAALLTEASLV